MTAKDRWHLKLCLQLLVFLKIGCIYPSGKKAEKIKKICLLLINLTKFEMISIFTCHFFIVCHWKPFYQVFQTIPVGRNFSKLLQRETSKPVLRACMLFFKRTEAEHGNSLVKNLCVFLPDILYSEDSFQPFKGLHCPLHGAVLLMKIEGNTSTP